MKKREKIIETKADGVFGKLCWWVHMRKNGKSYKMLVSSNAATVKEVISLAVARLKEILKLRTGAKTKIPKDIEIASIKRALASAAGIFEAVKDGSTVYVKSTILTIGA